MDDTPIDDIPTVIAQPNDRLSELGLINTPSDEPGSQEPGSQERSFSGTIYPDKGVFVGMRDADEGDTFTMFHCHMIEGGSARIRGLKIDWSDWITLFAKYMNISEERAAELESFAISAPTQLAYEVMRQVFGADGEAVFVEPCVKQAGWPRFWELLGYALPGHAREKLFTPSFSDLLKDYMTTRHAKYQTPVARIWINFCFTFRTVGLVLLCIGVALRSAAVTTLLILVPPGIKNAIDVWWHGLFR